MGLLKRKKNKEHRRGSLGIGLADHHRAPRRSERHNAPEPERLTGTEEEADVAVRQMEEPTRAEG